MQVVYQNNLWIGNYTTFTYIVHHKRGTAIPLHGLKYSDLEKRIDSSLMSLCINDEFKIVNVYAFSGTQQEQSREFCSGTR